MNDITVNGNGEPLPWEQEEYMRQQAEKEKWLPETKKLTIEEMQAKILEWAKEAGEKDQDKNIADALL